MWMWGNGGNWKSGNKWTINSPKNVQTLQYMVDLSNKYHVTESNPGKTNRTDGVWSAFAQGTVGMAMGSPGTFIGMLKKNPKVRYGIAAIPVNAGNKPVTLGVEDYLMAFKKSGNQAAVKSFLAFFYRKDNYAKFLTTEGFLPTTKSGSAALRSNPAFAPYLKLLPSARFYPWTTRPGRRCRARCRTSSGRRSARARRACSTRSSAWPSGADPRARRASAGPPPPRAPRRQPAPCGRPPAGRGGVGARRGAGSIRCRGSGRASS